MTMPASNLTPAPLTVCVVICTYRRPEALLPCLAGLARQHSLPDEVVLAVRSTDLLTREALAAAGAIPLPWRIVPVQSAGLVAARNVGLAACGSDIVCFCDDDTVAQPDWVANIRARFAADPLLGGLGGRDRCHDGTCFDDRRRRVVGRLHWFGRAVGNHHLGFGGPRPVDFLKGANMSFRMSAVRGLRFDGRLRGSGAQPHDDLVFSLAVRSAGWRLMYDPAVALDHFAAPRQEVRSYVAQTGLVDPDGFFDAAYNQILAMRLHLSGPRLLCWHVWSLMVGGRTYPGLVQAIRLTPREGTAVWRKFMLCLRAGREVAADLRGPGNGATMQRIGSG